MGVYTLYGFTNEKKKDISQCYMFYKDLDNLGNKDALVTYSELYYVRGFHLNNSPLNPYDFKYILTIKIDTNNIVIVRKKEDYIPKMFSNDGSLDFKRIQKHFKNDIKGFILFDINTLGKAQYVPFAAFSQDCIVSVSLSHHQTPLKKMWVSTEDCTSYDRIQCLNSHSCALTQKTRPKTKTTNATKAIQEACKDVKKNQQMQVQHLNRVMLPYKFYSLTEHETSLFNNEQQYTHFKPRGFWFAQGDEWLQHMKKTNFRINNYNYLYELELNHDELLFIHNLKDLYYFTKQFCASKSKEECWYLDWDLVVKTTKASGVLISPNLKAILKKYKKESFSEYFKGMDWYLTWDIASGAIWNKKGVKSIKLVYRSEPGKFVEY